MHQKRVSEAAAAEEQPAAFRTTLARKLDDADLTLVLNGNDEAVVRVHRQIVAMASDVIATALRIDQESGAVTNRLKVDGSKASWDTVVEYMYAPCIAGGPSLANGMLSGGHARGHARGYATDAAVKKMLQDIQAMLPVLRQYDFGSMLQQCEEYLHRWLPSQLTLAADDAGSAFAWLRTSCDLQMDAVARLCSLHVVTTAVARRRRRAPLALPPSLDDTREAQASRAEAAEGTEVRRKRRFEEMREMGAGALSDLVFRLLEDVPGFI